MAASGAGGPDRREPPIGPRLDGSTGQVHRATQLDTDAGADGGRAVDIELLDETMMRLDLNAEAI